MEEPEDEEKKNKLVIKKYKTQKIKLAIHMRRSNIFFNIISSKGNTLQQFSCANFDIHNSKKRKNLIRYDIAYAFGLKLKEAGINRIRPYFTNGVRGYKRILRAFKKTKLTFFKKYIKIKKYKAHNGCPKKSKKRKHRSIKKRKLRFKIRRLRKKKKSRLKKFRYVINKSYKKKKIYLPLMRKFHLPAAVKKKLFHPYTVKKIGWFSVKALVFKTRFLKYPQFIFFRNKMKHFLKELKEERKKNFDCKKIKKMENYFVINNRFKLIDYINKEGRGHKIKKYNKIIKNYKKIINSTFLPYSRWYFLEKEKGKIIPTKQLNIKSYKRYRLSKFLKRKNQLRKRNPKMNNALIKKIKLKIK